MAKKLTTGVKIGYNLTAMLVQSVTVKNFKLLGDFAVEGLRPVTLLGGKNGCGKSSLLEAVLLCMHRKKSAYPVQIALRGKRPESEAFVELFHNRNIGAPIEVVCRGDGVEDAARGEIEEEWEDAFIPPRIGDTGTGTSPGTDQVKLLRVKYWESGEPRGSIAFKIGRQAPYVTYAAEKTDGRPFQVSDKFIHCRPDGGLLGAFGMDAHNFKALDREGGRAKVEGVLRLAAPHARGIGLTEDGLDLVARFADGLEMSTASLGAGARKLLSLALVLHARSNGLFLLDEVTVGWHHSHLVDLWRLIFRACKERNHQVIATTHSDEGITAFAEAAAREGCEADACYVRLDRKDDNGRARVSPAVYDHKTLAASREMHLEVRG